MEFIARSSEIKRLKEEIPVLERRLKQDIPESASSIIEQLKALLLAAESCDFRPGEQGNVLYKLADLNTLYDMVLTRASRSQDVTIMQSKRDAMGAVMGFAEEILPEILTANCGCHLKRR
jgi:hypothetical protein